MATAVQRDDPIRHPIQWERTEDGLSVSVPYLVDTADRQTALAAAGLPAFGSAFSAEYPLLLMRGVRHESVEGPSWSWVRVQYREINVVYPDAGVAYTDVEPAPASTNVGFSREDPPRKLPSGGANVEILQYRALVVRYYRNPPPLDFGVVDTFLTPVNSDELTLPPQPGSTVQVIVPPGLARYRGRRTTPGPRGTVEVSHELLITGKDWNFRYYPTDADGLPSTSESAVPLYPTMPLMPVVG